MPFRLATVLGAPIGQDTQHRQTVVFEERQHPVVQQIRRGDRRFGSIELGKRYLAVGIDKGLLVDPADTLERADVEGVL